MKTSPLILAIAAMLCMIGQGTARAEKPNTPETVAGQVTKIDPARSRVTVTTSDASVNEFEASKETLQNLKVGDRIEAKRRPESK